jgi:branched-subunit amino acid aminotransferase/4-amino-4-deoxychorismate lyase
MPARRDQLSAPPVTAGILHGIIRDNLILLTRHEPRLDAANCDADSTELHLADEASLCGTLRP